LPSSIEALYRAYRDRGFAVVAIDIGEDPATVAAWRQKYAITPPVLFDRSRSAAAAYRVTATPTAFVVDRGGKLVAQAVGRRAWDGSAGRALVEALLSTP
jgi:peroxiredoxin